MTQPRVGNRANYYFFGDVGLIGGFGAEDAAPLRSGRSRSQTPLGAYLLSMGGHLPEPEYTLFLGQVY